jgi:hypothetical protein
MKLHILQKRIGYFLDQEMEEYKNSGSERAILFQEEFDGSFPILLEMELFGDMVAGYAGQIAVKGSIRQGFEVSSNDLKRSIFDDERVQQWYLASKDKYPLIRANMITLDYLRLLCLEFIQLKQEE